MRGNLLTGIAIGAATVLFGPLLWRSGRPAFKQAVRAGMEGYGHARTAAARLVEEVEDLVAEVSHEMQEFASEVASAGDQVLHTEGRTDD